MRALGHVVTLVVALAGILALSAANLQRERRRLLAGVEAAAVTAGNEATERLSARIVALEQDTLLMIKLIERTRNRHDPDEANANRVIGSAFEAIANVVSHYKTIVLFRADGSAALEAVDPVEDPSKIGGVLLEASRPLRNALMAVSGPLLNGPLDISGGRSFYFYAARVRADEAIVVTADAAMFLGAGIPMRLPASTLIVADPLGHLWVGCHQERTCHQVAAAPLLGKLISFGPTHAPGAIGDLGAARWMPPEVASAVGLDPAPALLAGISTPTTAGLWRVWYAASAGDILTREDALLRQLFVTSLAAALAVVAVGLIVLRQQRRAAALQERLRHAEEKQDLERQLIRAEKLISVGVLSAGIAHEIGTPLAVIRGRAESLAQRMAGQSKLAQDLAIIVRHIDGISSTIAQVLDFSRTTNVERHAISLSVAIGKARELVTWKIEGRALTLELAVPEDLPPLSGDPEQLVQVLVNVLSNACDACKPGGAIRLAARHRHAVDGTRTIVIECRDDGCGIAAENLHTVFDPFFTTKKRGEGAGLGLSVVASIVRNHGGDVRLASVVDAGTTITIAWPAAAPDARREAP